MAPEKLPRDPQEHPRGAQEPPKRLSRAPKRSPRVAQNTLRTMVGSKTSILQNSSNVLAKIDDFEGQRVILGAQNRLRGARRGGKDDLEEDKNQRSSEESLKKLPRSPQVTIYRACQRFRASTRARGRLVQTNVRPTDDQRAANGSERKPTIFCENRCPRGGRGGEPLSFSQLDDPHKGGRRIYTYPF